MFKRSAEHIFGAILFIVVLAGYLYTITPTLPFWDCGEFISCAYSMGVPHPPGTPLIVLIGNLFVRIFFFIPEVALRVNLLSAVSSALGALFLYLIMLKIFVKINNPESISDRIVNIFSAFTAALAGSFMYSYWLSSVEVEVYTPSTFIVLFLIWIVLNAWERVSEKNDDRFIFLIIYLSVLSIGMSLLPLLILPGAIVFFVIVFWEKHHNLAISLIAFAIFFFFLYIGMTKESVASVIIGLIMSVLSVVVVDYFSKSMKINYKKVFTYLFIYIVLILIALTPYLILILRAKHNPYINIAAPTDLQKLWDVFNRKQYGPMVLLPRQTDNGIGTFAALMEQFKVFFKYYLWQFGNFFRGEIENPTQFIKIISSLLMAFISVSGLYGMYVHFKKEKKTFLLLFITFFLLSAGLVVYLNLKYSPSDPNPAHYPREVRERDYFYLTAYFFFMLFVAMGIRDIIISLKKKTNSIKRINLNYMQVSLMGIILVLSILPFAFNINSYCNRRNNWIADEYAKNMLLTPRENSVIFTNGDNDTYPLWFEQVVRGFRTYNVGESGVMVVNLSLLNVDWYIKQMKSFGVPISMTDREIEQLTPVRIKNGEILFVRDIVIRDMIYYNTFEKKTPRSILYATQDEFNKEVLSKYEANLTNIYFSVTVSEDSRGGYQNNLVLEGLAYRLVGNREAIKYPNLMDIELTTENTLNRYSYRYILDDKIFIDDNVDRIKTNYASGFLQLGIYYANRDSIDKAIDLFKMGKEFYVYDKAAIVFNIVQLYMRTDKYEEAIIEIENAMEEIKDEPKQAALKTMLSEVYIKAKQYEKAEALFDSIAEQYPNEPISYVGKLRIAKSKNDTIMYNSIKTKLFLDKKLLGEVISFMYMQKIAPDILMDLLENWIKINPNDVKAKEIIERIKNWQGDEL